MIYLALGIILGMIAGFSGAVIYLRTYLRSMEDTLFRIEDKVKAAKAPSSSTSVDKDSPEFPAKMREFKRYIPDYNPF